MKLIEFINNGLSILLLSTIFQRNRNTSQFNNGLKIVRISLAK